MQISIDAGAIRHDTTSNFGTHTYTCLLLDALNRYGTHSYRAYTFAATNWPYHSIEHVQIPQPCFMRLGVSLYELLHPSQIFLGLNQVYPFTRARLFGFSHGLATTQVGEYYTDAEKTRQRKQLHELMLRSERIFTTSQRVTDKLRSEATHPPVHTLTLPLPQLPRHAKANKKEPIIMYTCMNHPVKRVKLLVDLFRKLKRSGHLDATYQLLLVGPHHNLHAPSENIYSTGYVTGTELAACYARARIYVCTSAYESYHFPYVEAVTAGCAAIGLSENVIPELSQYVHTANTMKELEEMIVTFSKKTTSLRRDEGHSSQFSWKKMVAQLEHYYRV